jgi:pSer/pThr/pTyr-binding forkhead associated (FHA) protein
MTMSTAGSNSYRISHRETGNEYLLNAQKLSLRVGRDRSADIHLDSERVSKRHAIFTFNTGNGNAYIEDMGSRNGTKVDDKPLQGDPRSLRSGEVVEIAGHHFDVMEVGGGPSIPLSPVDGTKPLAGIDDKVRSLLDRFLVIKVDSPTVCLIVRNLEQAGRRINLDVDAEGAPNKWTIGSDPAASTIHLPGGGVSRLHATISALRSPHGLRWKITDEVAQNKLYINQDQYASKFLSDGDRIIFGDVLVQFVLPRQEPPKRTWWHRLLHFVGLS